MEITITIDGPDIEPIERTVSRGRSFAAILVPVGAERTVTARGSGYSARRTVGVPPEGLMVSRRLYDPYGQTLSYDLRTNNTGENNQKDIVIEGADFRIAYDFGSDLPIADTWTSFSTPAIASADWRRQEIAGNPRPDEIRQIPAKDATETEIRAVLSNVKALYMRGEFSGQADDKSSLDSVRC